MFVYIINCDTFSKITVKWLCPSLFCYNNFCTKTGTGDKIKYILQASFGYGDTTGENAS